MQRYLEQPRPRFYRRVEQKSGLLLGKIDVYGDSELSDFRPLPSLQAAEMEAAIVSLEASPTELHAIGFFRTHDEERLYLTAADVSLAQAFFSHPKCIFLLIHPRDQGPANAGFFFWDQGRLNADFCSLEFAFEGLPNAPAVKLTEAVAESVDAPVRERAINKIGSDWLSSLIQHHRPKTGKLLWVFLGCLAIVSSAMLYWAARRHAIGPVATPVSQTALASSPLGLRVEGRGEQLLVSWDRGTAVESAQAGLLHITDGSQHREIRLELSQLDGSVLYTPISDDVTFRLQLQGKRGLVTESVRVVDDSKFALPVAAARKSEPNTPRSTSLALQPMKRYYLDSRTKPNSAASMPAPSQSTASSPSAKSAAVPDIPVPTVQTATPLASELAKTQTPPLSQTITSEAPSPETTKNVSSTIPAVPTPAPVPAVEKTIETTKKAPVTDNPGLNSLPPAYSPPSPLVRVMPDTRAYFPWMVDGIRQVAIHVSVDASGHVTDARPVEDGVKRNRLVTAAAIAAAKRWVFQPAKLHGRTVPSEHTIFFSFHNPAH